MQKKVVKTKKPKEGSNKKQTESIFNYDAEIKNKKKKISAKQKRNLKKLKNEKNDFLYEDHFLGTTDVQKPSKKALKKQSKKQNKQNKKNKTQSFENEKFIDTKEVPKISKKKLDKIKKKKKKENIKKEKELKKLEKIRQKQIIKNNKLNPKNIAKRKKRIKIAEIISLILIIIFAIALFLLSPIFKITKIEVAGNEKILSEEIISLSRIEKNENIFKINLRQAIQNIKQNTYIESVVINRKLAGTIQINVKERSVEYLIENNGSYAYVDKKGFIIETNQNIIENIPKILGCMTENIDAGNKLVEEDVNKIKTASEILNVAENYDVKKYITSINIENEKDFVLNLESENKTVHLGDTDNLEIKILYMQSILEKEKDKSGTLYLDVDFRNKYPYASWQ